jgi:hypothetical protein
VLARATGGKRSTRPPAQRKIGLRKTARPASVNKPARKVGGRAGPGHGFAPRCRQNGGGRAQGRRVSNSPQNAAEGKAAAAATRPCERRARLSGRAAGSTPPAGRKSEQEVSARSASRTRLARASLKSAAAGGPSHAATGRSLLPRDHREDAGLPTPPSIGPDQARGRRAPRPPKRTWRGQSGEKSVPRRISRPRPRPPAVTAARVCGLSRPCCSRVAIGNRKSLAEARAFVIRL